MNALVYNKISVHISLKCYNLFDAVFNVVYCDILWSSAIKLIILSKIKFR